MDVPASMPDDPTTRYRAAVEAEDARLTDRLASIRACQDAGTLGVVDAAAERIAAMEEHLATLRQVRQQYLGGQQ